MNILKKHSLVIVGLGFALIQVGPVARATTVGYWRFENGIADTADAGDIGNILDSSGFGNNGTGKMAPVMPSGAPVGRPVYRSDVPVAVIPQTNASNTLSLQFDNLTTVSNGSSYGRYVEVPNSPSLQFNNSSSMTFEAWVKLETLGTVSSNGSGQHFVAYKKPLLSSDNYIEYGFAAQSGYLYNNSLNGFRFGKSTGLTGHELAIAFGNGASTYYVVTSNFQINDTTEWHYISAAFDAATHEVRFILDDQVETVSGLPTTLGPRSDSGPLLMGIHRSMGDVYDRRFDGWMDEVRISSGVVPMSELLLTAVPEPSSILFASMALGSVVVIGRRRKEWQKRCVI